MSASGAGTTQLAEYKLQGSIKYYRPSDQQLSVIMSTHVMSQSRLPVAGSMGNVLLDGLSKFHNQEKVHVEVMWTLLGSMMDIYIHTTSRNYRLFTESMRRYYCPQCAH